MLKSGLFSFALGFALYLVVCSCAVISEETALELKDFKAEPVSIEENSDWSEGENIEQNDENNGARELNDGIQQGVQGMSLCCAFRSDTFTCLYRLSSLPLPLSLIHRPLPVFSHLFTWKNS